jgi:hypothetical protein
MPQGRNASLRVMLVTVVSGFQGRFPSPVDLVPRSATLGPAGLRLRRPCPDRGRVGTLDPRRRSSPIGLRLKGDTRAATGAHRSTCRSLRRPPGRRRPLRSLSNHARGRLFDTVVGIFHGALSSLTGSDLTPHDLWPCWPLTRRRRSRTMEPDLVIRRTCEERG